MTWAFFMCFQSGSSQQNKMAKPNPKIHQQASLQEQKL
jgi:hypothetical protein